MLRFVPSQNVRQRCSSAIKHRMNFPARKHHGWKSYTVTSPCTIGTQCSTWLFERKFRARVGCLHLTGSETNLVGRSVANTSWVHGREHTTFHGDRMHPAPGSVRCAVHDATSPLLVLLLWFRRLSEYTYTHTHTHTTFWVRHWTAKYDLPAVPMAVSTHSVTSPLPQYTHTHTTHSLSFSLSLFLSLSLTHTHTHTQPFG